MGKKFFFCKMKTKTLTISLHSAAASINNQCKIYNIFASEPLTGNGSSSDDLSDNNDAAHWIICGNAALTNLHLDNDPIASDKLGLRPCKMFCTTTLSNVW